MLHLGGHYAVVALDAVAGLAEPAAGLDEGAHLCDPHRLDERLPHRLLSGDEDGVHGIIGHPFPDMLVVEDNRNPHLLEVMLGSDPAEEEQLRTANGAGGQYDVAAALPISENRLMLPPILILELHRYRLRPSPCYGFHVSRRNRGGHDTS